MKDNFFICIFVVELLFDMFHHSSDMYSMRLGVCTSTKLRLQPCSKHEQTHIWMTVYLGDM